MKKNPKINMYLKKMTLTRGFILPFTMLITVLVLFITTGALALLTKQQYFSKLYKETQAAYYAADDAVACTTMIDDSYVASDGLGIFPSSQAGASSYVDDVITYINTRRDTPITKAEITCGQSQIFTSGGSPSFDPVFAVTEPYVYYFHNPVTNAPDQENGITSTFNMKMDLGLDPTDVTLTLHLYRCAKVTVHKTPSFRQIIAQGYSKCDGTGNAIERAVVNTTIIQ